MKPSGRTAYRAIPADFAKEAKGMLVSQIMAKWSVGKTIALRWRAEAGFTGSRLRPQLSAEEIQHLTDTMTQEDAANYVGVSNVTFRKMQHDAGVAIAPTRTVAQRRDRAEQIMRNRLEIPVDFLEYLGAHSQEDTAAHFRLNISTVQRWARQLGFQRTDPLTVSKGQPPAWWDHDVPNMTRDEVMRRARVGRTVATRWAMETGVCWKRQTGITFSHKHKPQPPKVDMSLAGRAADYLRPRWPSHRCTEDGQQDINGSFWRFGSAILTGDEVIARAERRGFDPQAWARIAA
jgi:transposase